MDEKQYCVQLSVNPSRGLMDEKFVILVQNAPPGSELTVHALHQCDDGHGWDAFAHYITDATGSVNVSEDCSLGGRYSGIEPMGLLWSLRAVPGSKPGLRIQKKNVQEPMLVTVSVYEGHRKEGFADLVPLASVLVERWYMAPGVRRIPVAEDGLTTTLFLPPGPGPLPTILDLWGSVGQLVEYRAALMASHGLAALTIDYLTADIVKETGKMVNLQYFETAYKFLQEHPQILGSRIAMLGLSLGSSVTVRMATYSEVMKVGRLQCPLMLIVGEDDQMSPTREAANDIKEMMGNGHLLTVLSYPDAGHLIEPPYTPHFPYGKFRSTITKKKMMVLWGGEPVAHSRAQEDSWKKILLFLWKNLLSETRPAAAPPSHL
ncbi:peroxisomal succinyl-coenzyme A thioesterase-like [Salarias fasciatus]|uniref:peroxisomal succinyl-coenzyme A thioesterase-like n=1 Tax=Salarias fasciatus TaxID=181472 RepID=UPI001176F670|nr:peroxisomal succinyl-coenzyme A thioesterase-like [Salarias fasciatus]